MKKRVLGHRGAWGFTLIEVLVAFGLLSVALAGIAQTYLHVYREVIEQDQRIRLVSALHELWQGQQLNPQVDYFASHHWMEIDESTQTCGQTCSPSQLHQFHMAQFKAKLPWHDLRFRTIDCDSNVCVQIERGSQVFLMWPVKGERA